MSQLTLSYGKSVSHCFRVTRLTGKDPANFQRWASLSIDTFVSRTLCPSLSGESR